MLTLQMILVFAVALSLSLASLPMVARLAIAYGLLDKPDGGFEPLAAHGARRVHKSAVPRLGGVGIAIGFLGALLIWPGEYRLGWLLTPGLAIFAFGVLDDLRPTRAEIKLAVQVAAVGFAVFLGGLELTQFSLWPGAAIAVPTWLGFCVSVFIVVGAINAINMIDGLDGLAGGIVLIGVVLLTYLHFLITRDLALVICVSLPLVGAILGFLRYNTHPATIFMGDGGSNWLGYMTGILMLMVLTDYRVTDLHGAVNPHEVGQRLAHVPFLSVVLCLAVPVFDTASVIANRLKAGLHPMRADKRHFHHTLLKIGLNHAQSVATVYFVAVVAGILGLLPVAFPGQQLNWVPYVTTLGLAVLFPLSLKTAGASNRPLLSNFLDARAQALNQRGRKMLHFWETANRYTIYSVLILAPVLAGTPHYTLGVAAGVCGAAFLLVKLLDRGQSEFLEGFVIACSITVLLVANNSDQIFIQFDSSKYNIHSLYNGIFIWLGMSTLAFFTGTIRRNYLIVSPTDFLFVVFPLVLILLPEPMRSEFRLPSTGLKLLVLFAALRTMVRRQRYATRRFGAISLLGLAYVFLAGVFGMRFVD